MSKIRVLLTGPSGRVGPHLLPTFEERYDLHTFDRVPSSAPNAHLGTLQDIASLREAMRGVEVVLHLAATSDEAPFLEELVPNNIEGLYNVLVAAHEEGVRRVVFTSSVQAVGDHLRQASEPAETHINAPNSLYGITKIFGELLGEWFHKRRNLEFVAIRLGWFERSERVTPGHGINNIWISPADSVRLFQCAIEAPNVGFAVVNGTSITPRESLSLESARKILGYEPQDQVPKSESVPSAS